MSDITSILNQYRSGDFEQRLSLFLNYRDIRDEFIKIDEAELTANQRGGGPVRPVHLSRCFGQGELDVPGDHRRIRHHS